MRMFSRRSAGYLAVATGLVLTLTGPLSTQSQGQEVTSRDQKQLVESLRSGGYVIVVRHGATFSDQADTDPFNFDNLAKQRNLSEKGKELAKAFGDAIRQVGIPAGEVYTSNFNRAFETAVLAGFKDIKKTVDLTEGGLVVSPDENSRRAAALRKMLAQMPEKGKNTFLITHKPNIIQSLPKASMMLGLCVMRKVFLPFSGICANILRSAAARRLFSSGDTTRPPSVRSTVFLMSLNPASTAVSNARLKLLV